MTSTTKEPLPTEVTDLATRKRLEGIQKIQEGLSLLVKAMDGLVADEES